MERSVYITSAGAYLPGKPVPNDEIEDYLGSMGSKPGHLRKRVLASNGIETRYYALDKNGSTVELNQDLAAKAVLRALDRRGIGLEDVDLLAFGTTQGDVPVPGFASMVHGRLGGRPMELISVSGVCCSSMTALNAAYRALLVGHRKVAVAGGSELVSRILKASRLQKRRSLTLAASRVQTPKV